MIATIAIIIAIYALMLSDCKIFPADKPFMKGDKGW